MKKLLSIAILLAIFSSCGNQYNGELTGVPGRKRYFEPDPYGMRFIPQGSYTMGPSDQVVNKAQNMVPKRVTVEPFWMDDTEITNNEYRQFVYWVRDSLKRELIAEVNDNFRITENQYQEPLEPDLFDRDYYLVWDEKMDMREQDIRDAVQPLYLSREERFYGRKDINVHKLNYRYYWVDYQQAAKSFNKFQNDFNTDITADPGRYNPDGYVIDQEGATNPIDNRGAFIIKDVVNVYPDTLVWIRDFTFSYNEPMAARYFWHPSFDDYPVVGVSWKQASAFCIWRTAFLNSALLAGGEWPVADYRLPTETEWEYAARGGLDHSMYPWGGLYTRNRDGCLLANFKPMRGNYADDGAVTTSQVGFYEPNEYGLYEMAGNVSEWTSNAYDESAYVFTHDLNPDYKYNARPDDPPVMKRKVIRGGSWKDVAFFLQNSTRDYEYQDSAKSYIGFRCVRSYMGNK